ncbi:hypothetical protein [Lentzea sp. NPDC059081]|uniref:hypothetical protein n=1 Tax=Lentzea sp. NPDC059081 TaxID=3346719 RepID=UPI003695870A
MTSTLPPMRDLPPGRQARIRAEVERAVTGRPLRRLVVPVLAGAAVVAAVVASVVALQPLPPPTPAVQVTTSPAPVTPAFPLPPERVKAIEEGCSRSASSGAGKLRQYLDEETRWALLYSENAALTCEIGGPGGDYNSGFGQTSVRWLPGHFSVDSVSAHPGGDLDGRPGSAGRPGYRQVVGRVDGQVTRVTVEVDGRTTDAKIVNGTFAVRVYYPRNWAVPWTDEGVVVRAYDANGALLGTGTDLATTCYFDPGTREVIYGWGRPPVEKCLPATPWR